MSVALERGSGISGAAFVREKDCCPIYEKPAPAVVERGTGKGKGKEAEDEDEYSCSSSSIGRNSDLSGGGSLLDGEESGETEVQSRLKGPLETMDALEDSLPIRRGISNFYCGKSKSFTSLADAAISPSVKELAKPENPYSRKRKILLAFSVMYENPHGNKLRSTEGGLLKRPAISSQSTPSSTIASSSSPCNSSSSGEEHDAAQLLPPHHPSEMSVTADADGAQLNFSHAWEVLFHNAVIFTKRSAGCCKLKVLNLMRDKH